ncbi:hypothetical protein RDABS01_016305 [Bienertia sinuspersici]
MAQTRRQKTRKTSPTGEKDMVTSNVDEDAVNLNKRSEDNQNSTITKAKGIAEHEQGLNTNTTKMTDTENLNAWKDPEWKKDSTSDQGRKIKSPSASCPVTPIRNSFAALSSDSEGEEDTNDDQEAVTKAKAHLETTQHLLHQDPHNETLIDQECQASRQFREANTQFQSWLHQKAKLHWLQMGDSNSKIFYNSLKARSSRNTINRIMDNRGKWLEDMNDITEAFIEFYKTSLSRGESRTQVNPEVVQLGVRLTDQHKELLSCKFTDKEIKQAMFSIPSNKAPGLDGYNSQFFKTAWPIVGKDVIQAIKDLFANGKLLKEVSITTLTMVPKIPNPSTVSEYRPIACCSTIYKCIAKLLCSRLSMVLPDIISHNQGAFVSGRSIMHNVLICQDLMRFYRPSQIQDCCMFKLDVKKAYDTVS